MQYLSPSALALFERALKQFMARIIRSESHSTNYRRSTRCALSRGRYEDHADRTSRISCFRRTVRSGTQGWGEPALARGKWQRKVVALLRVETILRRTWW